MRNKPDRSLFKRYDDANHWGLFIPIGRKKMMSRWDTKTDGMLPPAAHRLHFFITIKYSRFFPLGFHELRVRIGTHYL